MGAIYGPDSNLIDGLNNNDNTGYIINKYNMSIDIDENGDQYIKFITNPEPDLVSRINYQDNNTESNPCDDIPILVPNTQLEPDTNTVTYSEFLAYENAWYNDLLNLMKVIDPSIEDEIMLPPATENNPFRFYSEYAPQFLKSDQYPLTFFCAYKKNTNFLQACGQANPEELAEMIKYNNALGDCGLDILIRPLTEIDKIKELLGWNVDELCQSCHEDALFMVYCTGSDVAIREFSYSKDKNILDPTNLSYRFGGILFPTKELAEEAVKQFRENPEFKFHKTYGDCLEVHHLCYEDSSWPNGAEDQFKNEAEDNGTPFDSSAGILYDTLEDCENDIPSETTTTPTIPPPFNDF